MAIVTLGDLLDRAEAFEKRLEERYAAIRDRSGNNGVRLLTYYLARHRRHLQNALKDIPPDTAACARSIELKCDIDFEPARDFPALDIPPERISGQELLQAAVGYDTLLVNLYERILQFPLSVEAADVIEALMNLEKRDLVMLKKMMAMDYF